MWKQLFTLFQTVFTLARDIEETRTEIKSLREEFTTLTLHVIDLKNRVEMISQREEAEREKLEMKLDLRQAAQPKALLSAKKKSPKK
jgi:regulator of replication initiation timing